MRKSSSAWMLLACMLATPARSDEGMWTFNQFPAAAVKAKAAETGQEALSRGQQVAQDVAQTAAQAAKESGSRHASDLADSARGNAAEAADAARSSVQE